MNTTVRNRLGKIAQDISITRTELPADGGTTSLRLTVFLDNAPIRYRPEYQRRYLDVVVGKIECPNMSYRVGLVQQAARSSARQLRQALDSQG